MKLLAIATVSALVSGCGAYGTGLPNGDTPQKTYRVKLTAGGSASKKRVQLNFFDHPERKGKEFTVGQSWTQTMAMNTGERVMITVLKQPSIKSPGNVSCRIQIWRNGKEYKDIRNQDPLTTSCYTGILP